MRPRLDGTLESPFNFSYRTAVHHTAQRATERKVRTRFRAKTLRVRGRGLQCAWRHNHSACA